MAAYTSQPPATCFFLALVLIGDLVEEKADFPTRSLE